MIIGVGLVVLGIAMVRGYEPVVRLPKLERGGKDRSGQSMFVFGVSYAVASTSCALPLFTNAVAGTFRREHLPSSIAVFVAYRLGITLVLLTLTITMSVARRSILRRLPPPLPPPPPPPGALLIVADAAPPPLGGDPPRCRPRPHTPP